MKRPGRALVLGLGRFGGGREAARFLLRRGWQLRIADDAPAASLAEAVAALRGHQEIEWALDRAAAEGDAARLLDGIELVVVNPGVPSQHAVLTAARDRGIPCTQEVNLFVDAFPGRVVLVTGTNGKSTTATLLAAALRQCGIDALLGGNIGHSLLADEAAWHREAVAVLEISSFQLERLDAPDGRRPVTGAVLTRVTADHLDRHGSLAAYHAAKATAAAAAVEFLVHQDDDEVAAGFASPALRRVRCVQREPRAGEIGRAGDWVVSALDGQHGPVLHARALRLTGTFQLENVMAAAAAAMVLGARSPRTRHAAALALCQQRPLPFRLQRLLVHDGVEIYDNSVSTEVQSTRSALAALAPPAVHWVGGGISKGHGSDYAAVAAAIRTGAVSAHLFGTAAEPLSSLLRGHVEVTCHDALEGALDQAWATARRGDRILFSPAFASFDQFPNFRARAGAFHAWVARLAPYNALAGIQSPPVAGPPGPPHS